MFIIDKAMVEPLCLFYQTGKGYLQPEINNPSASYFAALDFTARSGVLQLSVQPFRRLNKKTYAVRRGELNPKRLKKSIEVLYLLKADIDSVGLENFVERIATALS